MHVRAFLSELILQRVKVERVPKTGWKKPILGLEKQFKELLQLMKMKMLKM